MQHHAFVIEAEVEEGVARALEWTEKELGMVTKANPDVVVLKYGLFSVEDARKVHAVATQAPLRGTHKVIVIAAARAYHEAQNALLKLFEEPTPGTYLFLILPTLGGLLPTLRSRVQVLKAGTEQHTVASELAHEFLKAAPKKRGAMIKKLTSGKDEDERRDNRDKVLAIVNGVEAVMYRSEPSIQRTALLEDTARLRDFLHDRSAPVKMILEHLSLVIPKGLT
ncbi:MAG: hypothetical protein WC030_02660 [Candidatus Paceibacterota bacterium]